jgi:membrane protein
MTITTEEIYGFLGLSSFLICFLISTIILNRKYWKNIIPPTLLSLFLSLIIFYKNQILIKMILNLFSIFLNYTFNFLIPAFILSIILLFISNKFIKKKIWNNLSYLLGAILMQFSIQYFVFKLTTILYLNKLMSTVYDEKYIFYVLSNLIVGCLLSFFIIPSIFYKKRLNYLFAGINLSSITTLIFVFLLKM